MYFRDGTAPIRDAKQHLLWVALEAGSGIVPQHDYDPSVPGGGAWWNVTNDPVDPDPAAESPLWAFGRHRALGRRRDSDRPPGGGHLPG